VGTDEGDVVGAVIEVKEKEDEDEEEGSC